MIVGSFEIHLTFDSSSSPLNVEQFKRACEARRCKPVFIYLDSGEHDRQLMCGRWYTGAFDEVKAKVQDLTRSFEDDGYRALRAKIEALPNNRGVPVTDEEARAHFPSHNYFEFHAKVECRSNDIEQVQRLKDAAASHDGHVSWNVFKRDISTNIDHRFVTWRMYGSGRESAYATVEVALKCLADDGFEVLSCQREYACYDTKVDLDRGWLHMPK